jgi:hypothetical protein
MTRATPPSYGPKTMALAPTCGQTASSRAYRKQVNAAQFWRQPDDHGGVMGDDWVYEHLKPSRTLCRAFNRRIFVDGTRDSAWASHFEWSFVGGSPELVGHLPLKQHRLSKVSW